MDIFGQLDRDVEGNLSICNISTNIDSFDGDDSRIYKCIQPSILVTTIPYDWDELLLYWKPWDCKIKKLGYLWNDEFHPEDSEEVPEDTELQVKVDTYSNGKLVNTEYYKESEYGNIYE